jgi:hypothetical protein
MRNLQKGSELRTIAENKKLSLSFVELDVADDNPVTNAIQTVYDEDGRIDVLLTMPVISKVSNLLSTLNYFSALCRAQKNYLKRCAVDPSYTT